MATAPGWSQMGWDHLLPMHMGIALACLSYEVSSLKRNCFPLQQHSGKTDISVDQENINMLQFSFFQKIF